ncbi:uncharacterized protein KQ657_004012 [Scheffersomyces spartinae]|uniref:Uncharacterized protein n=1 Tax=Scheffersomyces spartinae TaxID=45513 RepID=A0A9P7VCQ1_9ASCO|nr:uncharacterized protein KQ657_004012 [Scheffersomyces spartinae]KAG7194904.1 hypothetical protein KQ657_004012 [Scheffersomyces spartinae]
MANINADPNNNSALSSLLHSPLHQPLPPLQLTQPLGTFPKQRLSSINSITSNQSFTLGQSTVSGPGPLHHLNTTHNIPSSATSQQPRSMSIISLNSPRESLISADDLKNLPGTRNNSYNSLVSLLDLALRKQKQSNNSNKRGDTSLVSDDEDLGLHLNNTNMLLSSLKPSMGHGKLQLPASMVFTEFKRLSSGSNPLQPTSGGGGGSNPNYISPGSSHLKMHDLTPSPLSLAENPFNDYNFAQAQARHHHRQCSSLSSHKIDPIQSHQPVSDAESDISLMDHHISGAPDGDRDMTTVESPIILPSVSPTSSSISNASMSSTNLGPSSTAPLPPSHQRTPSISNENSSATNPAKKLKSIRQVLLVSKSSSKKPSITSSQPSTSSQALLLKKKYIFSKDIQFELLQKKTSAVNEMITTKFVRLSSLPQSKSKFSTGERESSNDDTVTQSKSFDEKSTGTQTQWKQQQKLIQQLNRKWNKNDLELSDTNTSSSASATTANSRKRSRGKDDDDDDNVE